MFRKLEKLIWLWNRFGWIGFYSLFFPVYWKQDADFKNGGYDILSIHDNTKSYFYGRWCQNKFMFDEVGDIRHLR